jgi:eukaryotic-like serine/threonine-protein kinase
MNHISTEILFEKFEIIDCLKKDTHTGVYLANHIFLSKKIILKTLNTDGLSDKTVLERFKREAKILAGLEHPNIIKVLDFGTYSNFFYISFEYFDGVNLREVINNNNLSIEDKVQLITKLLKALNTAHNNSIVHRDIKPENILVNSTGELKIADFGLALVMNDNNITHNATVVGTPSYMSPEQIRGEKTHQTDLFSAGLVCFELFIGRNPVLGNDVGATINNILNFEYESIAKEIEKLPNQIQQAINCMLHNNLSKRAKSASEVLKCLGIDEGTNIHLRPNRKFKIVPAYLFVLAILIAAIISFVLYMNYSNNSKTKLNTSLKDANKPVLSVSLNSAPVNSSETKGTQKPTGGKEEALKSVKQPNKNAATVIPGNVSINCYPWAEVFIDNKKIDITPLHNFSLSPGKHKVELLQPDFPPFKEFITIKPGKTESIDINFEEMVGYLDCEVYPWGEVYINNKLIGTTPFSKPIALLPGIYQVTVKNANYAPVKKEITINIKQKSAFSLNFQGLNK